MRRIQALAIAAALLSQETVFAEEAEDIHPLLTTDFSLNVGVFFPERTFKIGIDATVPGIEREIDISEQLNLSTSETTEAYEIGWRFSEHWLLRTQYFSVGGSRSATLNEDVQWGDYTFGAGTGVFGGIDVSVARLFIGRTYSRDERREFGFGAGVHRLDLEAHLAGQAIINNDPPLYTERRVSTNGPLPNLGAWYVYSFTPKWALSTRLDWLSASIDKYDGTIINASAGVVYAFNRHFAAGLSYNYFEVDVDINEDNWTGFVEQTIDGAFIYLSGYW